MTKYATALVVALCLCVFQSLANAQTSSYAMWFQPGVTITKLTSTMIVPAFSNGTGTHAVWPGLENDSNGFVYQNVISDVNGLGKWQFWMEYCCNPNVDYTAHDVMPGDTITSTFSLNVASGVWSNSYCISGSNNICGSSTDTFAVGILDKALLAVELHSGASWDFGAIKWTNIAITATTNSTAWCGNAFATSGSFGYQVSGSTVTETSTTVTCGYSNVLFNGPQ